MKQQTYAGLALAALLGLAGMAAPANPAKADWLVTREAGRVETRGAWTVKGKLVVFKTADGQLSSLRLADVDLDASRRVTEEAVAAQAQADAAEPKPAERRKSVRTITDKDVRTFAAPEPAAPDAADAADTETGEEKAKAPGPTSGPGLLVESWRQSAHADEDYVIVNGTLQNASNATAADLKLKVMIFDDTGSLIATSQAAVEVKAIPPGERATFRAEFPGFFSFATVKFEAESRRLATRATDEPIPPAPPENGR
ncbi:MAG TPA: FxLYD domain-containing protein [Thermoanaerobaculia bacterium]|nr:FxLYD domain-containing protein [Thermoanaerobaculia bacterium]